MGYLDLLCIRVRFYCLLTLAFCQHQLHSHCQPQQWQMHRKHMHNWVLSNMNFLIAIVRILAPDKIVQAGLEDHQNRNLWLLGKG